MRTLLPACLFLGIAVAGEGLGAENLDVPPPKPPLVAAVPENAAWTIAVEYPAEAKPPSESPKRNDWRYAEVQTTKVGRTKRDLITSRDGLKQEHWYVDAMLFWTNPKGEVSVTNLRGGDVADPEEDSPSVASGFPGVAWIKLEDYRDAVLFEKRPCYHYARGEAEVWIDAATRLPAGYRRGNVMYRYRFEPRPAGPLVMPPAYQAAFDTLRRMYGVVK